MSINTPKTYQGKYKLGDSRAYKISRSKIEMSIDCPRCFYIDRVLGVPRPDTPPFTLNTAVDKLLKTEFDSYRVNGSKHPLQTEFGIDADPAPHEMLDKWRENFHGIQYYHIDTNLLVFGAIDDLWINSKGEYIVVDYKATAKADPVVELDEGGFHDQYRRQMEIYQWLLRQNGHKVSNTGYFVYCTGDPNNKAFDKKLEFRVHVFPYEGKDNWVEAAVREAYRLLNLESAPESSENCKYCRYFTERSKTEAFDISSVAEV